MDTVGETTLGGPGVGPGEVDHDPLTGLEKGRLGTFHTLAESVGSIGPSLSAAAIVPLAFAAAGGATWLTAAICTVGLLALAVVISEIAKRHPSIGGLYTVIPKGIGPIGGFLGTGLWLCMATVSEITIIIGFGASLSQFLQTAFSIGHSSRIELIMLGLIGGLIAPAIVTLRGIELSTMWLLVLEVLSILAISILLLVVLFKHGHIIDSSQLGLHGASAHGILLGLTYLVTSFGGFEAASVLGVESDNPRRNVPVAVIGSVLIAGVFFVLNAYIQVLGFQGTGLKIASSAVPLGTLSVHYGVKWLGDLVLLGVTISWFSVSVAYLNYSPRPLVAMAKEGVLPPVFGRVTAKAGVPIVALGAWFVVWLPIYFAYVVSGMSLSTAFGDLEGVVGYAYTGLYLLAAVAGIGYAFRHGFRKAWYLIAAVIAGGIMILEYWYSFNPLPPWPLSVYVKGFAVFVVLLVIGCVVTRLAAPAWMSRIGSFEEDPA
jgi:amino acid transporter